MFVVAFVFPVGAGEFLCTLASAYAHVNIPSCQRCFLEALVPVHPSRVCVSLHFTVFVLAHCPRARRSLVFVVAPFCIRASFLARSSYPTRGLPVMGRLQLARFSGQGY